MRTTPTRLIPVVCLLAIAIGGCGGTTAPSASSAPTSSLIAPLGGQTETEWGLIWDDLPDDFPTYPNAMPAGETAQGPASGTFVIDGDAAAAAASWYEEALVGGASDSSEIEGPLEDGSYIVHLSGDADCRIDVTAAPIGGVTTITILYGGACPNP